MVSCVWLRTEGTESWLRLVTTGSGVCLRLLHSEFVVWVRVKCVCVKTSDWARSVGAVSRTWVSIGAASDTWVRTEDTSSGPWITFVGTVSGPEDVEIRKRLGFKSEKGTIPGSNIKLLSRSREVGLVGLLAVSKVLVTWRVRVAGGLPHMLAVDVDGLDFGIKAAGPSLALIWTEGSTVLM